MVTIHLVSNPPWGASAKNTEYGVFSLVPRLSGRIVPPSLGDAPAAAQGLPMSVCLALAVATGEAAASSAAEPTMASLARMVMVGFLGRGTGSGRTETSALPLA